MGVSVSVSVAVLLTASLISFGMVYTAEETAQESYMQSQESMVDRQNNLLQSALEINQVLSFYDDQTGEFEESRIVVTNTGSTQLSISDVRLLINGVFHPYAVINLDAPNSDIWGPGEVLRMTLGYEFDIDETNRVKVIAGNGASDLKSYGGV